MPIELTKAAEELHGAGSTGLGRKATVYMDNHATTPVDPRVLDEMLPFFSQRFGNPASRSHALGWEAEEAVQTARDRVALLIGATPEEIVFTSGATESDNLAIKGLAEARRARGNHIISLATEHKAVLDSLKRLEKSGFDVTCLPVDAEGLVDLEDLNRAVGKQTILVTIMAANNEIGVLQPVAAIGRLCRERELVFHSDAAQAAGKIAIDVDRDNLDLVSISGHKMYGPKGVGALYVRAKDPAIELSALLDGGGHEHGMRSGTLNVPGIVGLGKACEIARQEMAEESARLAGLRDRLKEKILSQLDGAAVNGSMRYRLAGNLNLRITEVDGQALLMGINDIAVSSGAACNSAHVEPSYVLKALGLSDDLAQGSIRFGLGRFTTAEQVDYVSERVVATVRQLRQLN